MRPIHLVERTVPQPAYQNLQAAGLHPVLARVAAARGISEPGSLNPALADLIRPDSMRGLQKAAAIVCDAIANKSPILVVGDYDCDGATASALTVSGLSRFGAVVEFAVPNRFTHGYGLSLEFLRERLEAPSHPTPALIITVDNGIASLDGVSAARAAGIDVVITDHHLPGKTLPDANAIVNPNLPDCRFPSRHLAGVGVAFYLMAAVRAMAVERALVPSPAPALADLLDLVALGTVADVVPLDENNRRLVQAGLERIRRGQARPGIQALMQVSACAQDSINARDLGFLLGPRINAAGRLDDMTIGIACLLAPDLEQARPLAEQLETINRTRREAQNSMQADALDTIPRPGATQRAIVAYDPSWHQGIVGLLAGRLREHYQLPVFAFAPDDKTGHWRGSGRSIENLHLRDILARIDSLHPGLIERFGGHAMAAGLTISDQNLTAFGPALHGVLEELDESLFSPSLLTDGALEPEDLTLDLAYLLQRQIWGAGFDEPLFLNSFEIVNQRIVGSGHLQLTLSCNRKHIKAIFFRRDEPLPSPCKLAYRVQVNHFQGRASLQLLIEFAEEPLNAR